MKQALLGIVVIAVMTVGAIPSYGQSQEAVPDGARSHGSSWCLIVGGKYHDFLTELARLIEMGGEVQGGYQFNGSQYSALVCKRGKPAN